jgi:glyoxylase-like metal-dependent hydrolase (beta-lactamase superfamily II)
MFHDMMPRQGTINLDRRGFLAVAGGLVAAGILPKSALALAGPYAFKHGTFDISVVSDGTLSLPIAIISPDAKPEDLKTLLGAAVKDDKVTAEVNVLLVRSGSDVILIDSGSGTGFQETAGKIVESLKAAGTNAGAITKVIYTHAHPDHIWGAVGADGAMVFPNATHHVAENEWNFWVAEDLASKMPKEMEGMVKGTQGKLAAIKDKVTMFKPGDEVVAGISAVDTPGHTPGHVSFELAGDDGLIVTGDAITIPQVFFANPDWKFGFDADGAAAGKSRRMLLDMAASGKKKMLGYHWPYPGLGMAEAKDGAFVYVPMT